MGFRLALQLTVIFFPCRASARSLRSTFYEVSESLGGLSRDASGAMFWNAGGNAHQTNVFQNQVYITTTMLTTTTMMTTTTPPPTTTNLAQIAAAQAAAGAAAQAQAAAAQQAAGMAAAQRAAAAAAAQQAALSAQAQAQAAEAEKEEEPSPSPPSPPPPSPPPPAPAVPATPAMPSTGSFQTEMQGIISAATSSAANAVKAAVEESFHSHANGAMDSAVEHWKTSFSATPPFCDELTTVEPTTILTTTTTTTTPVPTLEPPVLAETTTAETTTTTPTTTPKPTTTPFPYKLYGEHDAYCIMRVTGAPTTTVDLGSSALGEVTVVDPSDLEFLRRKNGSAIPGAPVQVMMNPMPVAKASDTSIPVLKASNTSIPILKATQAAGSELKSVTHANGSSKGKEQQQKEEREQNMTKPTEPVFWKNWQPNKPVSTNERKMLNPFMVHKVEAVGPSTKSKQNCSAPAERMAKRLLNLGVPKDKVAQFVAEHLEKACDESEDKAKIANQAVESEKGKVPILKVKTGMKIVDSFKAPAPGNAKVVASQTKPAVPAKQEATSQKKLLVPAKQMPVKTPEVLPKAEAIAMGDAAEDALKKLKLSAPTVAPTVSMDDDAGSRAYPITGPPPGVDF